MAELNLLIMNLCHKSLNILCVFFRVTVYDLRAPSIDGGLKEKK